VVLPTAVLAGSAMHLVLKPIAVGTPGTPWVKGSLVPLIGIIGVSTAYFTLSRSAGEEWWWEARTDPITNKTRSYNSKSGQVLNDGGRNAVAAAAKRAVLTSINTVAEWQRIISKEEIFFRQWIQGGELDIDSQKDKERTYEQIREKGDNALRLKNAPLSLHSLAERDTLSGIVDCLLRLKWLELEYERIKFHKQKDKDKDKGSALELQSLQQQRSALIDSAKEEHGVHNLKKVRLYLHTYISYTPIHKHIYIYIHTHTYVLITPYT